VGGWVGDDSHVVFGQEFCGEKKCGVVCCNDATASSYVTKVGIEIFIHFQYCGIDCLACKDKFFVKNPSDVNANDEHATDFAFHLFCLFSFSVSLDFALS
jgi:hypothetical protein